MSIETKNASYTLTITIEEDKYMKRQALRSGTIKRRLNASFAKGVGSVIAIPGRYFAYELQPISRDRNAIAGDWGRVGQQLRRGIKKLK